MIDLSRANSRPSNQPLEDILKNAKPTSVRSRRKDEVTNLGLSAEAVKVLGSLPDLSFMQSKVLMFPLKD